MHKEKIKKTTEISEKMISVDFGCSFSVAEPHLYHPGGMGADRYFVLLLHGCRFSP